MAIKAAQSIILLQNFTFATVTQMSNSTVYHWLSSLTSQSQANNSQHKQTTPDTNKQLQTQANNSRHKQTTPDTSKQLQTQANNCRHEQTTPITSKQIPTQANNSRHKQTTADTSKQLQTPERVTPPHVHPTSKYALHVTSFYQGFPCRQRTLESEGSLPGLPLSFILRFVQKRW